MYLQGQGCLVTWVVPCETAAISVHVLCKPFSHASVYSVTGRQILVNSRQTLQNTQDLQTTTSDLRKYVFSRTSAGHNFIIPFLSFCFPCSSFFNFFFFFLSFFFLFFFILIFAYRCKFILQVVGYRRRWLQFVYLLNFDQNVSVSSLTSLWCLDLNLIEWLLHWFQLIAWLVSASVMHSFCHVWNMWISV